MELAAFVCQHIFNDVRPVLYVSRQGGDWQFLCGAIHSGDELPEVVGISHIFARDATLHELKDLPADWEAERSEVGKPWTMKELKK